MDTSFAPTPASIYARMSSTEFAVSPTISQATFLGYTPSLSLITITVILFAGASLGLTYRMIRGRWRARYMLPLVIGCYTITAGYIMRYPLRSHGKNKTIFIVEDLLVLLSPCAFIATEYSLLGRQAVHTGTDNYLMVKASLLAKVFIGSDITTFLIQAGGGSLAISKNPHTIRTGENIFKVGIIAQLASFGLFCAVLIVWLERVHKKSPQVWSIAAGSNWKDDWRTVAYAQLFSCACIIIRSIYRTVSGVQGYRGSLATNQAAFYICDALACFLAVAVYAVVWPGRYIDPNRTLSKDDVVEGASGVEMGNMA